MTPARRRGEVAEPPVGLLAIELGPDRRTGTVRAAGGRLADLLGADGVAARGADAQSVLGATAWQALLVAVSRGVEGSVQAHVPGVRGPEHVVTLHWTILRDAAGASPGTVLLAVVEDSRARQELLQSLRNKALRDPLTSLPNRVLFLEHLEQALRETERVGRKVTVAFVDVDDLKLVNESLGHEAGDELLVAVAQRLRRTLRSSDVAARISGDEFTVLSWAESPTEVSHLAERLLTTVSGPCLLAGRTVPVSVSIGLASGSRPDDAAALLNRADEALRRAKRRGKHQVVVFDDVLDIEVRARNQLQSELRRAVDGEELRLRYQPVVDLRDGRMTGAEALVRWQHPRRGLLAPEHFLGVAEESDLIVSLGEWVLEEACRQAARWRSGCGGALVLAVNVSARQLGGGQVVAALKRCLDRHGIPAASMRVEVTETAMTASAGARAELWDIDSLGVRVGIDDFGTGSASLTYLRQLPVHFLKIDRSFVADLTHDPAQHAIVTSVVTLATALGIDVIAEGVESVHQARVLTGLGCHSAQGFLYGRPMPAEQLPLGAPSPAAGG